MNGTLEKKPAAIPVSVLVTAIVAMTVMELFALYRGINGTLFALTMGLIGAVAGVSVGNLFGYRWKRKDGE